MTEQNKNNKNRMVQKEDFSMNARYTYWTKFIIFAVILIGIALVINLLILKLNKGRWDLTKKSIFTVSPVSKRVLSKLKVPVTIEYYVSPQEKLPTQWKDLQRQVHDKLGELASASNGKMKIEVLNPTLDEDWKKRLQQKGISPFAVKAYERDQISSKIIFSSIVISYKEKKDEIISQVIPSTFANLEYEIISRIIKMTTEVKPKVVVYAPLEPVEQWMMKMYMQMGRQPPQPKDNYKTILKLLEKQNYTVTKFKFNKREPIPKDAKTVVIMRPKELSERQIYELNKFLAKGGNVIIAAQTYFYKLRTRPDGGLYIESIENKTGLDKLLTGLGLTIREKILCDESILPMSMPVGRGNPVPVKLPHQIMINKTTLNKETPITQNVNNLLYLWGNPIKVDETKAKNLKLKVDTLFTTTEKTWLCTFKKGEMKAEDFKPKAKRDGKLPGAIMLSGKFPDLFAGKEAPKWHKPKGRPSRFPPREGKPIKLDPNKSKLILVGSTRMFEDDLVGNQVSLQYFQNLYFILNAVDALTVGSDLIEIRGKTFIPARFQAPSKTEILVWRIIVLAGIPFLFIVFGILRAIIRKRYKAGLLTNTSFFQFITGSSSASSEDDETEEEEEEEEENAD